MSDSSYFSKVSTFIEKEFHPLRFFSSFTASLIGATLSIIWAVSCSNLIFSGSLSPYISIGIALILISNIVTGLFIASRTSLPGIIPSIQEPPVAILSVIASTIVAPSSLDNIETTLLTLIVIIILTGILSGIVFFTLGFFRLGSLVRYVPYPVIGGFLAGTGWLLVSGIIRNYAGIELSLNDFSQLFSWEILSHWLPEFIFAFLLLITLRFVRHCLVLPAIMFLTVVAFYLFLGITGISIDEARVMGLLMQPIQQNTSLPALTFDTLKNADLSLIVHHLPKMFSIILLGVIGLLLNISGIEVALQKDIALNHELKITGIANILSGLMGGGLTSYVSLSRSVLNHRLGASSRIVGWLLSGFCALALFGGMSILSLLPEVLIGGLTLFLGLNFLVEWLYDGWWNLSKPDYFLVLLIVVCIGFWGLLQGLIVGAIVAMILFVFKSSRLSIIKNSASLFHSLSHVQRSSLETKIIKKYGKNVYILDLQGWLFFGTANQLFNTIRNRLYDGNKTSINFVLLDFRVVNGLDSSALINFIKIKQLLQKYSVNLILTNLTKKAQEKLEKQVGLEDNFIHVFEEKNIGLAWCEEQLLEQYYPSHKSCQLLETQLSNYFPPSVDITKLISYLKPFKLLPGEVLFSQGQLNLGMYFLESGQLRVIKEITPDQTKCLRTYKSETIIGEMGFYSQSNHSASVIADEHSSVYFFSSHAFKRMEREEPKLASAFHKFIVKLLIERLHYREQDMQNILS
ncbi:SulP family inorganic anion transporter [Crocosphaera sp.]|uniref:SulP family inorganic anion transporter n=1 Tax=Crocosphaera sp. TaxID=2729996 RepID=UPI00263A32FF|nr:SulP family inorganic anion transporter [Crocosphaera sp.]MDJ0580252.1 SulP family inorganic anion transporter [Crocosphaera sp.]